MNRERLGDILRMAVAVALTATVVWILGEGLRFLDQYIHITDAMRRWVDIGLGVICLLMGIATWALQPSQHNLGWMIILGGAGLGSALGSIRRFVETPIRWDWIATGVMMLFMLIGGRLIKPAEKTE